MKHSTKVHNLSNGIEMLAVSAPNTDVVSMGLHLLAGDAYVSDRNKSETAHIMEHLAFGANKAHPSMRTASEAISKNGAMPNASTSRLSMIYSIECAKFDWASVAQAFKTQIESPLFLEEEFQAEVGNVNDELIMRWDSPEVRLSQLAGQHFGHDIPTFKESLATLPNITQQDIVAHYERTHKTADMRLIIVGDLSDKQWQQTIDLFESLDLERGERQDPIWLEHPKLDAGPFYTNYDESTSIILDMNFVSNGRLSEEEKAVSRVIQALCFSTFHSRVYGRLREMGLSYHIDGNFVDRHSYSGMSIDTQIDPDNAIKAIKVIKEELDKISKTKVPKNELQQAIDYSCGSFAFSTQTVGALGGGYSRKFFTAGEVEDYYGIPDRFRAVTASDIQDLINRFYSPDNFAVAAIGPAKHSNIVHEVTSLFKPAAS